MRIIICALLIAIFSTAFGADNIEIKKYIDDIFTKSSEILDDTKISQDERIKLAVSVIQAKIDVNAMAMFALGRAKNKISAEQLEEFVDIYRKYVLGYYAKTLKKYTGQKASIVEVKQLNANTYIVRTKISDNLKNRTLTVSFLLKSCDNTYKIYDIITEGVSFLRLQQQEFNNILSKNNIEFLIEKLKDKINKIGIIQCN